MSDASKVIVFWDHGEPSSRLQDVLLRLITFPPTVNCYPPPTVNRVANGAPAIRKITRAIGKLGLGSVTQFIVFLDVVEDSQKGAFASFHKKPVAGGVMLVHCPNEGEGPGYTSGKRMAGKSVPSTDFFGLIQICSFGTRRASEVCRICIASSNNRRLDRSRGCKPCAF